MADATAVSFRKGSAAEHVTFRGVEGEVTVALDTPTLWVHTGNNEAGTPLAKADMTNVSTDDIAARDIAKADMTNISVSAANLPSVKLKLDIPTKTSQLVNDSGYINDISTAVGNATITIKKNNVAVGSFTTNAFSNSDVNIQVPTKTSDLNNDAGFITNTVGNLTNYTRSDQLAAVATSGAYSDLSGSPTLATVATSGNYNDLTNKPNLATVATSGSYTDLSNTPPVPVQSNWDETNTSSLSYIQNKPVMIKDIVVTPTTGVIALYLSEPFIDQDNPNATPTIKELIGGAAVAGTWADVAGSNKTEWTFTPTTADDILVGTWIITLEIDEGQ